MRLGDILKGIRLAKYIPMLLALVTKFYTTVGIADDLLDRLEAAAEGREDFVIRKGSSEATSVNQLLKRLHDVVEKLEGEL